MPRTLTDLDAVIAANVLRAREAAGKDQRSTAAAIDVHVTQLEKYENGRNRISAGRLWRLALFLGRPIQEFFPKGRTDA